MDKIKNVIIGVLTILLIMVTTYTITRERELNGKIQRQQEDIKELRIENYNSNGN
jgi:hypothetical protein